jgi:hypothetical protein
MLLKNGRLVGVYNGKPNFYVHILLQIWYLCVIKPECVLTHFKMVKMVWIFNLNSSVVTHFCMYYLT